MIEDGLAEVASCTFTTGCAIFDIVVKELVRISIQGERRGDSGGQEYGGTNVLSPSINTNTNLSQS